MTPGVRRTRSHPVTASCLIGPGGGCARVTLLSMEAAAAACSRTLGGVSRHEITKACDHTRTSAREKAHASRTHTHKPVVNTHTLTLMCAQLHSLSEFCRDHIKYEFYSVFLL